MPYGIINGVFMFYRTKGKGIPIIFVHPPLLNSANFNYQMQQLSAYFQVIAFDIRGHGKSGPSEAPLTYTLIAEDIKQLLDLLEIKKAYICGYSTGGGIALEAMLNYPDRFYGGILVSAMSEVSDMWLKTRLLTAITASALKAKRLLGAAVSWGNADNEQTFRNLRIDAVRGDSRNIAQYYYSSLVYNCTHKLKRMTVPQLLVYGEKDKAFRRYASILRRELPESELVFLKNVHHQLPTKAGDSLNRLISSWVASQAKTENLIPELPDHVEEFTPAMEAETNAIFME